MNQVWKTLNKIPKGPLKCTIKHPNGDINIDECKIGTKCKFTKEMMETMVKLFTSNQDGLEDVNQYMAEAEQMKNSIIDEIFKTTDEKLRWIEMHTFGTIMEQIPSDNKNSVKEQFHEAVLFFIHGKEDEIGKSPTIPILLNYCDPPMTVIFKDETDKDYILEGGPQKYEKETQQNFQLDEGPQKKEKAKSSCTTS